MYQVGQVIFVVAQNFPTNLLYVRFLATAIRDTENRLRSALVIRMQQLSIGYYQKTNAGALQTKVVRDVENSDITVSSWIECSNSVGIRYITVDGASHAWMGGAAQSSSAQSLVGTPYLKLDSTRALLSFLFSWRQFPQS